ncbi:SusC/RagA family TonB-linked outer membrane protein, partial [Bacteroides heparinolyticus]
MSKSNYFKERAALLLFFFAFMLPISALAQAIRLTGNVTDATGESIIGASVLEKGTTNGVITDIDGNFALNVSPNATIIISYVGYAAQEIPLNGRNTLKVVLKEDTEMLDEVVVIGYGTMKKSDMTGAISSVDVEELSKRTTTNPAEALQGKIAGVNIMKSGGNAGAGVQVKIRGVKTFGDNEPLYIIDGFPGDINSVNPQDIQAMEVLKDGAAAAIYGSVAANGVIIVTTKNGKKGETKIDFSAYVSMTDVAKKLDLLNADQYKKVHTQMYENWNSHVENHKSQYDAENKGVWEKQLLKLEPYMTKNTGIDTDWQNAMLRTGLSQNYMVSIRGGGENTQYSVSYNHADDKGIFLGNDYRQDNARLKLHTSKYIFDIDANMAFKFTDSKQPEYQLKEMYMISP